MLNDIKTMHKKFGVYDAVDSLSTELLHDFIKFRLSCIQEEFEESQAALEAQDAEELVDGLIDIMVFTLGTLDLMGVDTQKAWSAVMCANMSKEVGIKQGRQNPYGLPDLCKPSGWLAPSHDNNHGLIGEIFNV